MWRGATTVLVLVLLLLVSATDAAKELKGLKCYKCTSDNRDTMAICDADFWQVTTPEERAAQEMLCLPKQSTFCLKKVQKFSGYTKTTRGCVGDVDRDGNKLREGCETVRPDPETEDLSEEQRAHAVTVCFCKANYCNAARPLGPLHFALGAVTLAVTHLL